MSLLGRGQSLMAAALVLRKEVSEVSANFAFISYRNAPYTKRQLILPSRAIAVASGALAAEQEYDNQRDAWHLRIEAGSEDDGFHYFGGP
jgi:hypothetical protein